MLKMMKQMDSSTLIGSVQDVTGIVVSVRIEGQNFSGLSFVNGQGFKLGQVGSFVKIPLGYLELYGIVSQVGARIGEFDANQNEHSYRWMTVNLVGEGSKMGNFSRGISQYPSIEDEVHIVTAKDLARIYGDDALQNHMVRIGHIAGAESISALVDINKLVTRHCAVLGTTGSGKSTTVAGLLNSLSDDSRFPSSRILVLDVHGEYQKALMDRANIFKVQSELLMSEGESPLFIPYWALNADELIQIAFGTSLENSPSRTVILEKILELKIQSISERPIEGLAPETLSVDSPVPFSIHKLWYDLYCREFGTYYSFDGRLPIQENWAYEIDSSKMPLIGNPEKGIPPQFKKVKDIKGDSEKINYLPNPIGIRNILSNLGSKLRMPRFDFLFNPGPYRPDLAGKTEKDLDHFIGNWLGSNKRMSILDLSGVPSTLLNDIIGICLRIIYDGLFWSKNLPEGGRERPLLIVMEEAHNYLNEAHGTLASSVVQKIAKEGRKYGIGMMIVSQRPSEINPTILSQCGTFFALRLTNGTDRGHIKSAMSDGLDGLTDMLPILKTGEAIVSGEAVKLPMRTVISVPPKERRPDSQDPVLASEYSPDFAQNITGGWDTKIEFEEDYNAFVKVWRLQNSKVVKSINK
jgi:hypothetical protein